MHAENDKFESFGNLSWGKFGHVSILYALAELRNTHLHAKSFAEEINNADIFSAFSTTNVSLKVLSTNVI